MFLFRFILTALLLSAQLDAMQRELAASKILSQSAAVLSARFRNSVSPPPYTEVEAIECLEYLVDFMPRRDRTVLTPENLTDTVDYALQARYKFPWGKSVPWKLFKSMVLPYSVLAEPRDPWRPLFFDYFSSKNLSQLATDLNSASLWINKYSWDIVANPPIHFEPAPPNEITAYSPFQTMALHHASCTGLSVFLTCALRSVGIPARLTGTPHWHLNKTKCPDGDQSPDCGNHDWVEVWTEAPRGWSFVDEANNKTPPLNRSWFFPNNSQYQRFGTLNHSIFASSWAAAGSDASPTIDDPLAVPVAYFPMVWDWQDTIAGAWDVTKRYTSMLHP